MSLFVRKYFYALLSLLWFFLPIIAANIQISLFSLNTTPQKIDAYLLNFLWIAVGVQGLFMGITQIFHGQRISDYYDVAYSPFIKEMGYANIAFGVLGILCLFFNDLWWVATGIGYSIFVFSSAQGQIFSAVLRQNYSLANIGPTLWAKIFIPAIICVLFVLRYFIK